MSYARLEAGQVAEYPVYEGDIRLRFPNVSFATPFSPPDGYVSVREVAQPPIDYTKNLSEGTPVNIAGAWEQIWIISDASAEQVEQRLNMQWGAVRDTRSGRLARCDWTQLSDVPLTAEQVEEWRTYRQALRDVTQQADPFNIVWPTPPQA